MGELGPGPSESVRGFCKAVGHRSVLFVLFLKWP